MEARLGSRQLPELRIYRIDEAHLMKSETGGCLLEHDDGDGFYSNICQSKYQHLEFYCTLNFHYLCNELLFILL
jgi:hypothetical protein